MEITEKILNEGRFNFLLLNKASKISKINTWNLHWHFFIK